MTVGPDARAQAAAPAAPEQAPAPGGKSPHALRTISEAAQELNLPQHVLRFWETRFPGLKPLKRAGGRRYYRPEDMALLRRICGLLHDKGYTIKGAQKLLAEGRAGGKAAAGQDADGQPPAPDPAAEHLRREAAALLDELKGIRSVLTPQS
ncbi:MAG: MerR family transcriptional regulator [Rhodospirillales bacterium]